MLTSRSLLATALLSLTCATLAASGPAFAAGSATTPPRASIAAHRHRTETSLAGAHCATKSSVSRQPPRASRRPPLPVTHSRQAAEARDQVQGSPPPSQLRIASRSELRARTGHAESAVPSAEQNDAAMIASVLATPCQNTELTPEPENIELVRGAVLCLINRKRAENSESPLTAQPGARTGRRRPLPGTDRRRLLRARLARGETPVDRIRDTGYIPSTERRLRDRREPRVGHLPAVHARSRSSPRGSPRPGTSPTSSKPSTAKPESASRPPCPPRSRKAHPARPTRRSSASSSADRRSRRGRSPERHLRSLLWPDQRKEVVQTLSDSSYGTLEVTGR